MAAEPGTRLMRRMLIGLFEGDEPSGLAQLTRLIGLARLQGAAVRVAYFHSIPRDRTDRHDRVIADRYREMVRIEEAMREDVARLLRAAGRPPVEVVIRFGADAVAFAPGGSLKARWRTWRIRQRFASARGVRLLVLEGPAGARRATEVAMRPA